MIAKRGKAPQVSIIIRSFNEERHLGALLESIQKQDFQNFEMILVDSGSVDGTLDIAKKFPIQIEHIKSEDFTFGRSLNQGIAAARGEIVVMVSAHVLPTSKAWLSHLIEAFSEPSVAISYGMQRGGLGSKFSEDQHWRHWFPNRSNFDQEQAFCNNANSAIRRSLWKKQAYDEQLTGLEDIAWAAWAKEEGYKIAYVAEAEVAHLHDEKPRQVINRHMREAIALKQILPKSKFTFLNFLSFVGRKSMADMASALRQHVFIKEAMGIFAFRLRQYWGTYRGYQQRGPLSNESMQAFYFPPSALEPKFIDKPSKNNAEALRESN